MATQKNDKIERVLRIYTKLINGNLINKSEEATQYGVNERSIQRDMDDIRNFLALEHASGGCAYNIVYNRKKKGYQMEKAQQTQLSNGELLAVSKLLLGSQAFSKKELKALLDKIIASREVPGDRKLLKSLIENEMFHYTEQHGADLMGILWELGQAVRASHYIDVYWKDGDCERAEQKRLKPLAVLYINQYFYLAAVEERTELEEESEVRANPEVFRIDKMCKVQVLEERFHIPYSKRFEEGEFRRKVRG